MNYADKMTEGKLNYLKLEHLFAEWKIWSKCFGKLIVINGPSCSGKTSFSSYLGIFGFRALTLDEVFYRYCDNILSIPSKHVDEDFVESYSIARSFLKVADVDKIIDGSEISIAQYTNCQVEIIRKVQKQLPVIMSLNMPTFLELSESLYKRAAEFIFSGINVVLDVVIADSKYFDMLSYSFRYYPMLVGIVYASLQSNLTQCFKRNENVAVGLSEDYRYPSQVIIQYQDFYKFGSSHDVMNSMLYEKLDNSTISSILEASFSEEYKLLELLKSKGVKELINYDSHKLLLSSISCLKEKLVSAEVFVSLAIKCEFVVRGFMSNVEQDSIFKYVIIPNNNSTNLNIFDTIQDLFYFSDIDVCIGYSDQNVCIGNTGEKIYVDHELELI